MRPVHHPIETKPFGNFGKAEWTMAVGPSGVHLNSNIPNEDGGTVNVYLDFGHLHMLLADGNKQWSEYWRQFLSRAIVVD